MLRGISNFHFCLKPLKNNTLSKSLQSNYIIPECFRDIIVLQRSGFLQRSFVSPECSRNLFILQKKTYSPENRLTLQGALKTYLLSRSATYLCSTPEFNGICLEHDWAVRGFPAVC
jgi:hypothetical protein